MRFDFNAYAEVFPTQEAPAAVETAVEGFNPTADIKKATDNKPGDDILKAVDPEPAENGDGAKAPTDNGESTPEGE